MRSTFRAFGNYNYRLFAVGGVVSNVGTWMQRVAQDWLVLQLTDNSGTAIGITTGLQFLPILLLSPYAGLVADRFPKQKLLQLTQVAMATSAFVLGTLALTGVVQPGHVYLLAFLFGCAAAFDAPARQAFVSEMVGTDDLTSAVGLNAVSFHSARLIGPGLAGLLIVLLGSGVSATGWVIIANGVSYGSVVIALRLMRVTELAVAEPAAREKGMIREGVRYVRGRRDLLLVLTVVAFGGTFGLNFQMTSALMATQVYHKGAGEYGLLGSTMAIGSILGALLAARRGRPGLTLVVWAGISFGIAEIVAGLMPTYLTFVLWTPVLGLTALTMITAANATIQLSIPAEFRGRVLALYLVVFLGGTPFGAPVVGWVGQEYGARWTLLGGGALTVLGAVAAVLLFGAGRGRAGGHETVAALPPQPPAA